MKRSFRLFTTLAALGGASTFLLSQAAHSQDRPQVVASYSVLCDLAEQIAQDTVDVTCLIGAGEDPHVYNATPADRRAIESADLVFYGGYDFEPGIIQMVEATEGDTPKIAVSEVAVTEPLIGAGHDHGSHSGEDHDDHDDTTTTVKRVTMITTSTVKKTIMTTTSMVKKTTIKQVR
ncbi:MAG: zinc ABC transporter substrate-binding protein [Cyanobacteria bacterium J06631_12]